MNFQEFGLSAEALSALNELNFTEPTPIQEQAIPKLMGEGVDMMGLAQTGTGKTAAFAIPILEKIDRSLKKPQALILCPTRELCMQITKDVNAFSKFMPEVRTVAVYGGASIVTQIKDLRRGVQIVVATPGRLIDIMERGEVSFDETKIVVLDEADEMLNMGFKESINSILSETPSEKNIWLFTATMPKEIKLITKKYMKDPFEISVSVNKGNDNIEHQVFVVNPRDRYLALKRLVDFYPEIFGIVFCRTKRETKDIADRLIKDGYNSDALHGDLTQQQRDIVMQRYRDKSLQILVATDVAARGIDVSNVTHVINFALPEDTENYTHRSGRTARAGKKGISISLISKGDLYKIRQLEKIVGKDFEQKQVPTGEEVCENQLMALINRAKEVVINEEQIAPYMDKINSAFESMDKEDVIKHFASMEFNRFLEYYKFSDDLNDKGGRTSRNGSEGNERRGERTSRDRDSDRGEGNGRRRGEGGVGQPQSGYDRFFINIGTLDKVHKGDLLRLVCDNSQVRGSAIGRIDMKDKFSFFEVESKFTPLIISNLKTMDLDGRSIRVDLANSPQGGGSDSPAPRRRSSEGGGFNRDRDNSNRKPFSRDNNRDSRGGGFNRDRDSSNSFKSKSREKKNFEPDFKF